MTEYPMTASAFRDAWGNTQGSANQAQVVQLATVAGPVTLISLLPGVETVYLGLEVRINFGGTMPSSAFAAVISGTLNNRPLTTFAYGSYLIQPNSSPSGGSTTLTWSTFPFAVVDGTRQAYTGGVALPGGTTNVAFFGLPIGATITLSTLRAQDARARRIFYKAAGSMIFQ
jgi:hypothetical protein